MYFEKGRKRTYVFSDLGFPGDKAVLLHVTHSLYFLGTPEKVC